MKKTLPNLKKSTVMIAVLSSMTTASVFAVDSSFLTESKTKLNFRYRFENVDQDGIDKDATASTLRSRLNFQSGAVNNLTFNAEIDNVSTIGADDYNDGSAYRNKTEYAVVADPTGTSVNQLNVQYKDGTTAATLGRQRINLGNQRFVGGVAWRQNEQTFDGVRGQYAFNDAFFADYSYVYYVSRIFGPDGPKRALDGNFHFLNLNYKLNQEHNFTGFAYLLDADDWADSNDTYGIDYTGKFGSLKTHASVAAQSNGSFDARYYALDGTLKISMFDITLGFEQLGSDHGEYGFSTPLATGHKFQGFVDKFLSTPKAGVRDYYGKIATKLGSVNVAGFYHKFEAATGNVDFGTEFDLVASYKVHKTTTLLAKYADYNADNLATDTKKVWLMANVNFNL